MNRAKLGSCLLLLSLYLSSSARAQADSTVVLNELMYHPADELNLEWLELHNQMSVDMDLSGWSLSSGVQFVFAPGTILPGRGYLVVARNPAALAAATGFAGAFGPFQGRLENSGEAIELVNNNFRLMDTVRYRDEGDWPVAPDGSGVSLAKIDPDSGSEPAASWAASAELGGTPGRVNFPSAAGGVQFPAGLVSFWNFDETGGTANDSAGGNDGTLGSGAVRVAGLAGARALSFDNTANAFVNVGAGSGNSFSTTTGITIEALLRPLWSGNAGDHDDVFRKEDGLNRILLAFQHDGVADNRDVPLTPAIQRTLSFGINIGGTYGELDMPLDGQAGRPTLAQLKDGNTHHVAATYDSGSGLKAIYLDGVRVFSAMKGAGARIASGGGSTAYIGNMAGRGEPFTGTLDEIAFWDRALSAAEVQSHVQAVGASGDYFSAPGPINPSTRLAFNETFASSSEEPWLEVVNFGQSPIALEGFSVASAGAAGGEFTFPAGSLAAGSRRVLTRPELGFDLVPGNKLFLYPPLREAVVDAVEVKDGLRGRHPEATGPWLYPDRSTPGAANSFSFSDQVVLNEILYHQREVRVAPGTEATTLVPIDAAWRYEATGSVAGTAWRQRGFDDGGWPSGRALIYQETADLPAPKNTQIALGPITYYFRCWFEFTGDPASIQLNLRPVIDDGAVFYLNGSELFRLNMLDGPVDPTTTADPGVAEATFTGPFAVPSSNLVAGQNLLAVEVHQATAGSTDVVFGVEVASAAAAPPGPPFRESREAWLELYNRSAAAVDLTGWSLDGGIDYQFVSGTVLGPRAYLVVAGDSQYLRGLHSGVAIAGDFTGRLSHRGELIVLRDAAGNPADSVAYQDGHPWPVFADGFGSSLELKDPAADNSRAEAWAASDEGLASGWRSYSYREVATANIGPTQWREFVFGLLDEGEALIDDVSVIESPGGAAVQLVGNGSFEAGASGWRLLGTHRHGTVIVDPDSPGNHVLHLVASGATEHMHNHVEATLQNGISVVNGRTYEVSFRARWLGGSNQLHTRLYFNRVPRVTTLALPATSGTPGARNTAAVANLGPTFSAFGHRPPVPAAGELVEVTAVAEDPQGVRSCRLWSSVEGGAWSSAAMAALGAGLYRGTIAGQASSRVVQFYVEAEDLLGAVATFPAGGRDSRALYRVEDGQARLGDKHNLRIVMTPADANFLHEPTNVMSNDHLGGTIIYDEREVFYDAAVRLKGSERGRNVSGRVGFNLRFPADRPFRGVHDTVAIDRSGGWHFGGPSGQDEILVKHMIQHAGGIPGMYDDLIRVIAPRPAHTGPALAQMARFGNNFLDSQWENGSAGTVFEFELIYYPLTVAANGLKLPEPDSVLGIDLQDLGDDPEAYRWNLLTSNNRSRDDYPSLIPFLQAMSLSGAALEAQIPRFMDVDEWMRVFAMQSLCGIGDAYTRGNNHNLRLYVHPDDGRVLAFPWDWDFAFTQSTNSSLWGDQNLAKVITRPPYLHAYYGHLKDLIESTYNTAYMSRWITHYGTLAERSYSSFLNYIGQRVAFVESQLPAPVAFQITTNSGQDFQVNQPEVVLEGNGGVDVWTVLGEGIEDLALGWTGLTAWRATVPLGPGANTVALVAVNFDGQLLGADQIRITSTFNPPPPVITAAEPPEALAGEMVEIRGTSFLVGVRVFFGATLSPHVARHASDRLSAQVPSLPPGPVAVTVRNTDGDVSNPVTVLVVERVPLFIRGDLNLSGQVDISDALKLLFHLFRGLAVTCRDAGDVDNDEQLELTDAVRLLDYLFRGGLPPAAPLAAPGEDPDGSGPLDCEAGL